MGNEWGSALLISFGILELLNIGGTVFKKTTFEANQGGRLFSGIGLARRKRPQKREDNHT